MSRVTAQGAGGHEVVSVSLLQGSKCPGSHHRADREGLGDKENILSSPLSTVCADCMSEVTSFFKAFAL